MACSIARKTAFSGLRRWSRTSAVPCLASVRRRVRAASTIWPWRIFEQTIAAIHAEDDSDRLADQSSRATKPKVRNTNRGALPKHLPRIEQVIEPNSSVCACGHDLHIIGEDVSERLDIVPAQFRVIVTRRPKLACRSCSDGVMQAPARAQLIEGGIPTEATVAHVLVSKYADHLPLYRQAQIYNRQGSISTAPRSQDGSARRLSNCGPSSMR